MRAFIDSLVGKLAAGVPGRVDAALERHFIALNKASPNLARNVALFIRDGSGGSVLSTLGTAAVVTAWQSSPRIYPRKSPVAAMLAGGDIEVPMRFGQVMSVLQPLPHGGHWGSFGTKAAPGWLRHAISHDGDSQRAKTLCPVERLFDLARAGGADAGAVLDILFHAGPGVPYGTDHSTGMFGGVREWLTANSAEVVAHQGELDASGRSELAHAIGRLGLAEAYLTLLVDYGVSTAKTVRGAATKALTAAPSAALRDALAERYARANPGIRTELVALALGSLREEARPLLESWSKDETEKKPREAIERALTNISLGEGPRPQTGPWERGYVALDGSTVALPSRPPLPEPAAIPESTYALLRPTIASYTAAATALREAHAHERNHWSRHQPLIAERDMASFRKAIEATGKITGHHGRSGVSALMWANQFVKWDRSGVVAFLAHPSVTLRHLIAILRHDVHWAFFSAVASDFGHAAAQELRKRVADPGQMQVAALLWAEMGGKSPVLEYLQQAWMASLANVESEAVWPLVADGFDAIDEALGLAPQASQPQLHAGNALDLLATLPKVPHRYLLPLMTIATGSHKALRQQARGLLGGAPNIDTAIAELLEDGKQDARAGAAEWLAARGTTAAIPALRKALAKDKSDVARAAIITALERLGDDVSDCFDPKAMAKEAAAGLAKASTKGLEWFPFDLLPRVSWRDGTAVDPMLLRWWVVLAHKLKQPGSNALLDLWLARLAPEDARRLGIFVLRSWIEQDTRRPSDEEGNAYALQHIDQQLASHRQQVKRWPDLLKSYPLYLDRDAQFAQLKRSKTSQYFGSATDSKGVLALATMAEGADAAAAVRAFLKDHGARVSQDKALLDVLAANPAPAAIQVVLSTANRFKARSVQEHAAALIERISERRGWTPEELADRTIPTAGLDERGEAELDCGEGRTYRLVLDASDALALLNPSGQPTKSLPGPRNDEEKALIAEAKKLVATARKELKQASVAQTERLYEAMCLERRWPAEEWERHLLKHPIVGRLLRRIVWIGLDGEGRRVTLFRPLDDGSLSDVEDGEVRLDALAAVQIAHVSLVSAEEAEAWRGHLADYEVATPFAQFERDLPVLPESAGNDLAVEDRKGWMIETFKLRGTATKLGFVRGQAQDGGVFMTYERRFEAARLVAEIEFSGSPLPEENIPAALYALRFARLRRGGGWHGGPVPLKEVPPVLLAESWRIYHRIAAAGTGFDPEWEKKAGW